MEEDKQRAITILQILKRTQLQNWQLKKRAPFETLVATILSQNTSDANSSKAFETLSRAFEITPICMARAELSKIEEAIKRAGLYKTKSVAIQKTAFQILEKYGGSMQPIFNLSLEEARSLLMELPGVGPKTADVVLLFAAGKPTIPVDTHVNRVAKRLGFAPENGNYETVRSCLQKLYDPKYYVSVHLLLISHGRKICKAQCPKCGQCPVCTLCPSCGKLCKP